MWYSRSADEAGEPRLASVEVEASEARPAGPSHEAWLAHWHGPRHASTVAVTRALATG